MPNNKQPLPARIQHIQSQSSHPGESLTYANLVGGCSGSVGSELCCENKKGSGVLSYLNPVSGSGIPSISVELSTGTLRSTRSDVQADIDDVLNLNCSILRENRKAALKSVQTRLRKTSDYNAELRKLQRLCTPSTGSELPPFVSTILTDIRKRIERSSHSGQA